MLKAGEAAPEFTLAADDGTQLALSSLRGRRILLWFFPEADTPGCSLEGRSLRDHREAWKFRSTWQSRSKRSLAAHQSGAIAVTSVSTIISGNARAVTPISVWTGSGAVPKFLPRHCP